MKNLILASGIGAIMLAMTGCCGDSCSVNSSDKGFNDSVSAYYGQIQGKALRDVLKNESEAFQQRFRKESFFKGLRQVLLADTADYAYMSGLSIGMGFNADMGQFKDGVDFNRELFLDEFEKVFSADSIANYDQVKHTLDSLFNIVIERATERHQQQIENSPEAVGNRMAGQAYIDKLVAEDKDVKQTESGLAYKVLKNGTGPKATALNSVKIAYKGTFIDGTQFDELLPDNDRRFPVTGFVAGFTEGLQLMEKGAKYIFYIPGNLAYGVDGQPKANIGPNETLIFEVELLDIYE